MWKGIPASAGVGMGRAAVLREPCLDYAHVVPAGPGEEKARLAAGVRAAVGRTQAMAEAMNAKVGARQADILRGQAAMLTDPFFRSQAEQRIDGGACAEAAADAVCQGFIAMFSALEDELMRQRATDIGDIRVRLLEILLGRAGADLGALPDGSVLVVRDLTPSMTAALDPRHVRGIVTESGGVTSHSAILARALAVPAVLSVDGATTLVGDGVTVVVDGTKGIVLADPSPGQLQAYGL